jgi:hypothetical protein
MPKEIGDGLDDVVAESIVEQTYNPDTGTYDEPSKEPVVYTGIEQEGEGKGRQDPDRQPATQQDEPRKGQPEEEEQEEADVPEDDDRIRIDPKAFWNKQQKDFFESQKPESQRMIMGMFDKMQYVFDRKTQDLVSAADEVKEVAEYVMPAFEYQQAVEEYIPEDMDYHTYIDELIDTDYMATNEPLEFICQFMYNNDIHINDVQAYGMPFYEKQNDPEYQKQLELAEENEQLRQAYMQQEDYNAAVEQQQINEVMDNALNDFQNETDEEGNLMYPYLADVEDTMAHLMLTTGEVSLPVLYEQACWLDPDIREEIIAMRNEEPQQPMPNMARGFTHNADARPHEGNDLDSIIRNAAAQPGATWR